MSSKLEVFINPLSKPDTLPVVRFEPHNGFNVRHDDIAGTWLPSLERAANDYNQAVIRSVERMRFDPSLPNPVLMEVPLNSCVGYISAIAAWQIDAGRKQAEKVKADLDSLKASLDSQSPSPVDPPEVRKEAFERLFSGKGPLGLAGLLFAALTLLGNDDKEDDTPQIFDCDLAPEIKAMLKESGLLVEGKLAEALGLGVSGVAVPKRLGKQWVKSLREYIVAGNAVGVRTLLVSADLLPS